MASCWFSKTPVQILLILVLCVTVPFLVAMLIVYIIYGATAHLYTPCDLICKEMSSYYYFPFEKYYKVTLESTVNPLEGFNTTEGLIDDDPYVPQNESGRPYYNVARRRR